MKRLRLLALTALYALAVLVPRVSAAPIAYVTSFSSNNITVIDTTTETVLAAPSTGGSGAYGVAINAAGTRVYVTNQTSNTFSVLDTATYAVTGFASGGARPMGIALIPDGTRAYIPHCNSNNVSVVDTSNNSVITTIPLGSCPFGVAATATRVYVSNADSFSVSVLDVQSNSVITTIPGVGGGGLGQSPRGIVLDSTATRMYVAGGPTTVIDTTTNSVIGSIPSNVGSGIAINPDGTRVYIASIGGGLNVADTSTNSVIANIPGFSISVSLNTAGTTAYVATGGNSIRIVDTATNTATGTIVSSGSSTEAFGQFIGEVALCGNGDIESGEQCDDGNVQSGDGCNATCQLEATPTPTATPTGTATVTPTPVPICGNGFPESGEECDDGNITPNDGCDASCQLEPCGPSPELSCKLPFVAGAAKLKVKNDINSLKDQLQWQWNKGVTTNKLEFGNPLATDDYYFCIYDGGALWYSASIPSGGLCAGKSCWKEGTKGFQYQDKELTPDGIAQLKMSEGLLDGKAKISIKGKGVALEIPDLTSLQGPIRIQLVKSSGGTCWAADYSAPFLKNDGVIFLDKAD